MKILKIFGIVVGIHVFALILIFANPGCSSTTRPAPALSDTVVRGESPPPITMPSNAPASYSGSETSSRSAPPIQFNPDAPAVAVPLASGPGRTAPTRPNSPEATVLVPEPVRDVTPASTYAVKAGDSLWSIAKKNHLTVAELAAANNLKVSDALKPGRKLLIPGKSLTSTTSAAPVTTAGRAGATPKATDTAVGAAGGTRAPGAGVKHVVKSGESLSTIAQQYGVRTKDIGAANNISDPARIKVGTELIIPGWLAPSGKSGKNPVKSGSGSGTRPAETTSGPGAEPNQPVPPPPAPSVPVISVDDNPLTPAPRP